MRSFLRLAWLALPALLACGSIDDPSERKPLAVIEGQLTQSQTAPVLQSQSNVRIAVVWLGIDDRSLKSTQDVKAEAVFPSKFKLALTEPPPESAMIRKDKRVDDPNDSPTVPGQPPSSSGGSADPDQPPPPPKPAPSLRPQTSYKKWPADFGVAVGAVVAYEDLNGNGKLDLVEDDATAYVDRVLGINQDLFLVYTEGTNVPSELRDMNNASPALGFNLLHRKINEQCSAEDCVVNVEVKWLPIGSLYDLPLTAEPRFGDIMCRGKDGFGGGPDSVGEQAIGRPTVYTPGPNGKYPAASDPNVTCSPDGKQFSYRTCQTIDRGLCKGTTVTCSSDVYGWQGAAPPAGWPCTAK